MSDDHRPECPKSADRYAMAMCICDRLRACEQRVEDMAVQRWALKVHEAYQQALHEGIKEGRARSSQESRRSHGEAHARGRREGYAAALNAAREAVKQLCKAAPFVWPNDVGAMADLDAAIDALREKP